MGIVMEVEIVIMEDVTENVTDDRGSLLLRRWRRKIVFVTNSSHLNREADLTPAPS